MFANAEDVNKNNRCDYRFLILTTVLNSDLADEITIKYRRIRSILPEGHTLYLSSNNPPILNSYSLINQQCHASGLFSCRLCQMIKRICRLQLFFFLFQLARQTVSELAEFSLSYSYNIPVCGLW